MCYRWSIRWSTGDARGKAMSICVHECLWSKSEPLVLFTWSQRALQGWLGGRPLGPSSPTHSPSPSLQTWRARACEEPHPSNWCLTPFGPTPGGTVVSWQHAPMTPQCPPVRKRREYPWFGLTDCNNYFKMKCSGRKITEGQSKACSLHF